MSKNDQFDYDDLKKKVLEQFRSGKSLFGKDGAFAPLLKEFLEAVMEAELDEHLDDAERDTGNRKNDRTPKWLKTADGTIDIETPRGRSSTFDPQIVKKGRRFLLRALSIKLSVCTGIG